MTTVLEPLTRESVAADRLERAAHLLSTGHWCTGELKETDEENQDKFCALGAVALVINPHVYDNAWDDSDVYASVVDTLEIITMARVIAERIWDDYDEADREEFEDFENFLEVLVRDDPNEVVYNFNDSQDGPGPVVNVMIEAARRLRENR